MTAPIIHNTIPHSFHVFSDVRGFPRIHDNTSGVSVQIKARDTLLINVPLRMIQGDELPIREGDNGVLLGMGYLWCKDMEDGHRSWNLGLSLPTEQAYEAEVLRARTSYRDPEASGFYLRASPSQPGWVPAYFTGTEWHALLNLPKHIPGGPLPVLSSSLKTVRSSYQRLNWRAITHADPFAVSSEL